MNKILYIFISAFILNFCSEEETKKTEILEDSLVVKTNQNLVLSEKEGTAEIEFTSSGNWTAEVDSKADAWCDIDQSEGASGANTIIVAVSENTSYDERNASIILKSGTASKVVTVTQKQKDGLTVTSNKVELKAEGGDFSIEVQTNVSVSYEIEEAAREWISAVDSKALSNKILKFTARSNNSNGRRQGNIILKGGDGLTETVTVYQEGEEPCLVLTSSDNLMVDSDGGTIKVEVRSNIEYELIIPEVDWINEVSSRAVSTYTHYLEVAPNADYESREAILVVRSKDGTLFESLTIIQLQQDAIIIARNTYNVTSEGEILELRINSNVDFETEIPVDWISVCDDNTSRALVEKKILLKIEKNPAEEERTGIIAFKYEDIVQKITICQDGRTDKMKIVLVHSEREFYPLDFQGNIVLGTVEWGDGTTSDLNKSHVFSDNGEKTTTFEVVGVDVFQIKNLNTISSIVIYCNEGKNGTTEDFDIENKEWD